MSIPLPGSASDPWLWAGLLVIGKASLLLLAAACAAGALRHASAARRHLVWSFAVLGLLLLPAMTVAAPEWRVPFLSVRADAAPVFGVPTTEIGAPGPLPWPLVLGALWALGAAAVLVRLAAGSVGVRLLARDAEAVTDAGWLRLADDVARRLGVRRRVRLLRGGRASMPVTWGALRPAILLPAEADRWTTDRRRAVLLHEMAHVARRDCLMQALATVACALYWMHPGVWWAARRMRIEREAACDDRVLLAGARPSDYAAHLLAVARAYRPPRLAAAAMAMARPSKLEDRVVAVLDAARDRRGVAPAAGAVCAGAALLALLPVAGARPTERAEAPEATLPTTLAAMTAFGPSPLRADAHDPTPLLAVAEAETAAARTPAPSAAPRRTAPARLAAAPRVRTRPARGIAPSVTGPIVATLFQQGFHPDARVRRTAAEALERLDDSEVRAGLVESLDDPNPRVRSFAQSIVEQLYPRPAEAPARAEASPRSPAPASTFALGDDDANAPARDLALATLAALNGEIEAAGGGFGGTELVRPRGAPGEAEADTLLN